MSSPPGSGKIVYYKPYTCVFVSIVGAKHHSSDIINNITPQSLCIHKKNCYFSLDSCQLIRLCSSLLS